MGAEQDAALAGGDARLDVLEPVDPDVEARQPPRQQERAVEDCRGEGEMMTEQLAPAGGRPSAREELARRPAREDGEDEQEVGRDRIEQRDGRPASPAEGRGRP